MSLTSLRRRARLRSSPSLRALLIIAALALLLAAAASSQAGHLFSNTAGHTTIEQIVTGDPRSGPYSNLRVESVNRTYQVRDGAAEGNSAIPNAQSGREQRRRSLSYFGQMTDFQLADEETPAKVEFADPGASSAWRPWEALMPFVIDYSVRQLNLFAGASPIQQGDGTRAQMGFSLMTGDNADSQQRNETIWVRELIEGGTQLNFNSGSTNPDDYDPTVHPSCAGFPPTNAHRQEALRYTGVQDYDDYDPHPDVPQYYDPDDVQGSFAADGWPTYKGLMDHAEQLTITPAGTDMPTYITNGNHDTLVQGNEDANEAFEDVATGCLKMLASTGQPTPGFINPNLLLAPPSAFTLVPPDPLRRYVDRPQVRAVYGQNNIDNDHGFDFVDPAELQASCRNPCADSRRDGAASYYAWDPPEAPGFRFISIDTVAEGGVVEETSSGNIDDPQFQWLKDELDAASAGGKLIVLFGHHPVRSLTADVNDESASPCSTKHQHGDTPEHDRNPGCDIDPRSSDPIHLGTDPAPGDPRESLVELLDGYPHLIAYVSGHTHENNVTPFARTNGGVWWGIETAAVADWPQQSRLIEVMDNRDGTLSIFGTILDHAAPAAAPPPCTVPGCAQGFDAAQMASIGRALSYNDFQSGAPGGEGQALDQNVELLVRDPRAYPRPNGAAKVRTTLVPAFDRCASPNTTHGEPLNEDSCSPANPSSDVLTVPNDDSSVANGSFTLRMLCTNSEIPPCPAPGEQADVRLTVSANDVLSLLPGGQYAGDLEARLGLRITDSYNGPTQSQQGTVVDTVVSFGVPCEPNPFGQASSCATQTSLNALKPGAVRENERAIWELDQIEVYDGGGDGSAVTTSDNTPFLRQALFVP